MPSNENMSKKLKSDQFTIGTHSGTFHCDEVLACFMIKQLPAYSDAKIIRSRDDKVLDECDMVIDVGGVFNHDAKRYDHHQKTFQESLSSLRPEFGENFKIRLSSAGLIYTFYGEDVIQELLKKNGNEELTPSDLKAVYKQIYKSLIQEIDGIDNGVPMFDGEPAYTISTHLSARIGNLNPSWEIVDYDLDDIFQKAMETAGKEFTQIVMSFATSWIKARSHVRKAIENAKNVHKSGEILELQQFCPWKHHLADLEKEYNIVGVPKYVLFNEKPGSWRVICVPNSPSSFVCRKFLMESWRGFRDEELSKLAGLPGLIFVHHTGFVGGADTRESVLQMAIKSLEN
ncbi:MYG1 protein [Episyrphus balteatus]|uniref:MYG1 protein n=1 Tax=Episyrphus balteatus TaxID=286459 RepID=UPI0024856EE8|nr:MYG1 protein [Episyrphus balteatus]